MIEIKNVVSAEVDALQDARVLTDGDAVNGKPISLLTKQVNSVHDNRKSNLHIQVTVVGRVKRNLLLTRKMLNLGGQK